MIAALRFLGHDLFLAMILFASATVSFDLTTDRLRKNNATVTARIRTAVAACTTEDHSVMVHVPLMPGRYIRALPRLNRLLIEKVGSQP